MSSVAHHLDALAADRRRQALQDLLTDRRTQQASHVVLALTINPINEPLLLHCVSKGYEECLEFLLGIAAFRNAAQNMRGNYNCTVLHAAAWKGQLGCLQILADHDLVAPLLNIHNDMDTRHSPLALPAPREELPQDVAWYMYASLETREMMMDDWGASAGAEGYLRVALFLAERREGHRVDKLWFRGAAKEQLRDMAGMGVHVPVGVTAREVITAASRWANKAVLLLDNCDLSDVDELEELLQVLQDHHNLSTLSLMRCRLPAQDRVVQTLLANLHPMRLRKLSLAFNEQLAPCIPDIVGWLPTTLETLDLCRTGLGAHHLPRLCASLQHCQPRLLMLGSNELTENGGENHFEAFTTYLASPGCSLEELLLCSTRLTEHQMQGVFDAMRSAPHLREIHLHSWGNGRDKGTPPHLWRLLADSVRASRQPLNVVGVHPRLHGSLTRIFEQRQLGR